jgi:hypothetical protein
LEKFLGLGNLKYIERVAYVTHLGDLAKIMGDLFTKNLGGILGCILEESEEIKNHFIGQMDEIL